jgi:hypothetical protein
MSRGADNPRAATPQAWEGKGLGLSAGGGRLDQGAHLAQAPGLPMPERHGNHDRQGQTHAGLNLGLPADEVGKMGSTRKPELRRVERRAAPPSGPVAGMADRPSGIRPTTLRS